MNNNTTPLEILNVTFGYPGNKYYLFKDVNISLNPGELSILSGENGSGKSTLMGLTVGSLIPTRGTVRVFGETPTKLDRIPEVALISEPLHSQTSAIPAWFTGRKISQWLENLGSVKEKDVYKKAEELHLTSDLINRPLYSYSKGQRQRFMLATVLARNPRLILADEPLEGIDAHSRPLICESFHNYTRQGGTLLWISHQLDETLFYADRFFVLENREISEKTARQFSVRCGEKNVNITSLTQLSGIVKEQLNHTNAATVYVTKN